MFDIVIYDLTGRQYRMPFETHTVTVGRAPECELVLPAGNVSGTHCRIHQRDRRFVLVDLDSTNGTYVNSRRLRQPTLVRPVDRISVGGYVLHVDQHRPELADQINWTIEAELPLDDESLRGFSIGIPPDITALYVEAEAPDDELDEPMRSDAVLGISAPADVDGLLLDAELPQSGETALEGRKSGLFIPADIDALFLDAEEPAADERRTSYETLPPDIDALLLDAEEPTNLDDTHHGIQPPDDASELLLEAEEPADPRTTHFGIEPPEDAASVLQRAFESAAFSSSSEETRGSVAPASVLTLDALEPADPKTTHCGIEPPEDASELLIEADPAGESEARDDTVKWHEQLPPTLRLDRLTPKAPRTASVAAPPRGEAKQFTPAPRRGGAATRHAARDTARDKMGPRKRQTAKR